MPRRIYTPYRRKTDPKIKKHIDRIIHDLEKYNLSVGKNKYASLILSKRLVMERNNENLLIAYDPRLRKSIVALSPKVKLKRLKNGNIEITTINI